MLEYNITKLSNRRPVFGDEEFLWWQKAYNRFLIRDYRIEPDIRFYDWNRRELLIDDPIELASYASIKFKCVKCGLDHSLWISCDDNYTSPMNILSICVCGGQYLYDLENTEVVSPIKADYDL